MRDRFFDMADTAVEGFAKLVLVLMFIGCTLYLTITDGLVGIVFFFVVISFMRWAWRQAPEETEEARQENVRSSNADFAELMRVLKTESQPPNQRSAKPVDHPVDHTASSTRA